MRNFSTYLISACVALVLAAGASRLGAQVTTPLRPVTASGTETLSNKTLSAPVLTGTVTIDDVISRPIGTGTVTEASPDTISLDLTAGWLSHTIDEATTLSFAAAPATGTECPADFVNSTSGDLVLTIPSTYSQNAGANITSFIVPANSTVTVTWKRLSSSYAIYGDPLPLTSQTGTHASPDTSGGAITITGVNGHVAWTNTTTTYTLPAASGWKGKVVIFYVTGTNALTIDPNSSEVIVRDGTAQTGGVTLTLTGAAGNYVALYSDGTRITTFGFKGTLAAGT